MRNYDLHLEEEVVENYLELRYTQTNSLLIRELLGEGCGCLNCKRQLATDASSYEAMYLRKPFGSCGWEVDCQGNLHYHFDWYNPPDKYFERFDDFLDDNLDGTKGW